MRPTGVWMEISRRQVTAGRPPGLRAPIRRTVRTPNRFDTDAWPASSTSVAIACPGRGAPPRTVAAMAHPTPLPLPFDDAPESGAPPGSTAIVSPQAATAAAAGFDPGQVEIRRSTRRRRTVSAYRDGDRTVVLVPARMSRAEQELWAAEMVARLAAREARTRPSDDELMRRAEQLSARYLAGRARPASVRWVTNQVSRWGSCTIEDASIRLSTRLQGMPEWVIDYVLLHELAHLLVPGHGKDFWALLDAYPRTQRAWGYLEGVTDAWQKGAPH
jgi:predicted metal-dependent hydrolase